MVSTEKKSSWKKSFKLAVLLLTSVIVLAACGNDNNGKASNNASNTTQSEVENQDISLTFAGTESDVKVATFDGGSITDKEFEKFKSGLALLQGVDKALLDMEGYREYILEQFVIYKHIVGQATDEVKKDALVEANTQLQSFKDYQVQLGADIEETVIEYGITEDDLATFFYLGTVVAGHLDSTITEDELRAQYEKLYADYSTYTVRHILIGTEVTNEAGEVTATRTDEEILALANEAKAKLEAGETWEEVAKNYSEDPGSKDNGGIYEEVQGLNWDENFKQASYKQEVGVIGEPVKSQFGYHVIKVENRTTPKYEELTERELNDMRYILSNSKFATLYDTQIEALHVEFNLPEVKAETEEKAAE